MTSAHDGPELRLVMSLTVLIDPPIEVGEVAGGFRRVIPITGGTFAGPDVRGEVVAGGADWNLRRPDGSSDVWARYTLRADDGVHIGVVNGGRITGPPERRIGRTTPCFEAPTGRYSWLNDGAFTATLDPRADGSGVRIEVFQLV